MKRGLALFWLLVVAALGVHVAVVASKGIPLQTDLMALLPREDRDEQVQRAKDRATEALSQRIVILLGHEQAEMARGAAALIRDELARRNLIRSSGDIPAADAIKKLGTVAFAHRAGLLSEADRQKLLDGDGQAIVQRVLSQVYGFAGFADGRLLARDPFLSLPSYLTELPIPVTRLRLDAGWPMVTDGSMHWVALTGMLTEPATALAYQRNFLAAFDDAVRKAGERAPGLEVRRLGALFYAKAGAGRAMAESRMIGMFSLTGIVALIVVVFRAFSPLLLGLTAIGVGMLAALSVCLALFGEVHVGAQLFGASLIGVAADYALLYFAQVFSSAVNPGMRLARVWVGLTLGMATVTAGYAALALSSFPGLRQVALLATVGLVASYLTVVLWFPWLDRLAARPLPRPMERAAMILWRWGHAGWRSHAAVLGLLALCSVVGALQFRVDDDVRHQQSLDPVLAAEQADIQRLTGFGQTSAFFVVSGKDEQETLRREEELGDRLKDAVAHGKLGNWLSCARFAPSDARWAENRTLIAEKLRAPYLAGLLETLGLTEAVEDKADTPLRLGDVVATGAVPLLSNLIVDDGLHLVMLDGLKDAPSVRAAASGLDDVRFIDPTADISDLLGAYRRRAAVLPLFSVLLMVPLLAFRYGWIGALRVMAPPSVAVAASPFLLALLGFPFSFFSALALMLALAIGTDYAVFYAEDKGQRNPVTPVAVGLAVATALLSFGLLAFSEMAAMRTMGATMLVAVSLTFLLAPLASAATRKER